MPASELLAGSSGWRRAKDRRGRLSAFGHAIPDKVMSQPFLGRETVSVYPILHDE
jgi:hypothetical protein